MNRRFSFGRSFVAEATLGVWILAASVPAPSAGAEDAGANAKGGAADAPASAESEGQEAPASAGDDRVAGLEREIQELRAELEALRAQPSGGDEGRFAEIERKIDSLAAEIERLSLGEVAAEADVSDHGLGPAASKIYRAGEGVTLGGYGELLYQHFDGRREDDTSSGMTDSLDLLRAVLYVGYKFDDHFLFNSEIEFEHATTGKGAEEKGEVSLEFAYLDYLWRHEANGRAGLVLVPMGFLNELHEPTVFLGARRTSIETLILPTTWRENGVGLFGEAGPVAYRTYVVNGFDAAGFAADGLRDGRQQGSQAKADDLAWVGRVDYVGLAESMGFVVGGSAYVGEAGQDLPFDVTTRIAELHAEWKWHGFEVRVLGARAEIDNVAQLNGALGLTGSESVGEIMGGWYAQVGYDLFTRFPHGEQSLVPFVRFESLNTQEDVPPGFAADPANDVEVTTVGLQYQPIHNLVLKTDYQFIRNDASTGVNQFNVGLGLVF